MKRQILFLIGPLMAAGLTALSLAPATAAEAEPGRVSDVQGSLQAMGGWGDDWAEIGIQTPVGPGDSLWLSEGGLAEIELPGGLRVRLRGEAKIEMPEASDTALFPIQGAFYFETLSVAGEKNTSSALIRLPEGLLAINRESVVRLDLEENGSRIRVTAGSARITLLEPDSAGRDRYVDLAVGLEAVVSAGADEITTRRISSSRRDELDSYHEERQRQLRRSISPEFLADPVVGYDGLGDHGRWVAVGGAYYFRPYVSGSWRPYSVGYWAWYRPYGWTWISYDPFGYATFHYGAWIYDPFYGWLWSPGYVWRPAHVHWITVGPYFAWAPLDPWGRPVTTRAYGTFVHLGISFDFVAWSYAPANYFVVKHVHVHRKPERFKPIEQPIFDRHRAEVRTASSPAPPPGFTAPGRGTSRSVSLPRKDGNPKWERREAPSLKTPESEPKPNRAPRPSQLAPPDRPRSVEPPRSGASTPQAQNPKRERSKPAPGHEPAAIESEPSEVEATRSPGPGVRPLKRNSESEGEGGGALREPPQSRSKENRSR